MKAHYKKNFHNEVQPYSRVVRYERWLYEDKWVRTGELDAWFRPKYALVRFYTEKRVNHWTVRWGNWIPVEGSEWSYCLKHYNCYRWWQERRRDAADRQDRREDRLNYKIKVRDVSMDPWDECTRRGRGKTYGFKSWKHGTKHRKQWMKNLED